MEDASNVPLYVALRVVAIPAGAALLAMLVARLTSAKGLAAARLAGGGVAIGAIAAVVGLAGVPPIPPIDTIGWLAPAIAAALVVLLVVESAPRFAAGALSLVGAAAAYLIGRPIWSQGSQGFGGQAAPWIALAAVAIAAVGGAAAFAAERLHPAAVLASLTLALSGGAVACLGSHSALLAMIMGGFAATAGAAAFGGLVLRVPLGGVTAAGVLAVAGGAVVLYARLYSALPVAAVALIVAAALAPALLALLRFRGRSLVAIVLAAGLAAGAAYPSDRVHASADMYK